MLHELDTALRALVERELGPDGEIEVDFDAPTKDWASHRNRPTIDIYLYDIRQDVTRYQFGHVEVRNQAGYVAQRQPQPKFFRLSYLVTAWTQRAEDEHRLLSSLLVTFLRHEIVPSDLLTGSLADLGMSVPLAVALPPPQDRSLSDVWSALGGELKPSLDLTLIAPLLPERATDAGAPVKDEPIVTMARLGAAEGDGSERSGGRPVPEDVERVPGQRPPPPLGQPRVVRRTRRRT
jgi:hypothetical protein